MQKTELKADITSTETLRIWIYKYKEFYRRLEEYIEINDIMQFFAL